METYKVISDDEARKLAQKAIDLLEDGEPLEHEEMHDHLHLARKLIELLDRQRWIPVSERLPEMGASVLVLATDFGVGTDEYGDA